MSTKLAALICGTEMREHVSTGAPLERPAFFFSRRGQKPLRWQDFVRLAPQNGKTIFFIIDRELGKRLPWDLACHGVLIRREMQVLHQIQKSDHRQGEGRDQQKIGLLSEKVNKTSYKTLS